VMPCAKSNLVTSPFNIMTNLFVHQLAFLNLLIDCVAFVLFFFQRIV
jgi:hypothetical protein